MTDTKLPLVTVVTPTWQRHDLVVRCVRSVMDQTYSKVQHIVVSDGPDAELAKCFQSMTGKPGYELVVSNLPEHNDSGIWGMQARQLGIDSAEGGLIAYLDDDNLYHPEHIERLVDLLVKDPEAGFAYSRFMFFGHHVVDGQYISNPSSRGSNPPMYAHFDTSCLMHRKEILTREGCEWRPHPTLMDWDLVNRWIRAGIKWQFDSSVTVDYFENARGYHEWAQE
jgi:glycosyltransferase involved in cell wall biosynthesis